MVVHFMTQQIEFYYDIASPFSYLAWHRLNELCDQHKAELVLRPVSIASIFKATGNSAPALIAPKAKYLRKDIDRYANRYRVNFTLNPKFPIDTRKIMRGAMAAQDAGVLHEYTEAFFVAMWCDGKDLSDDSVCKQVLTDAHLDAALYDAGDDEANIEALRTKTDEAIQRGLFGLPTMFANGEMLFGQDRLWVIEELLGAVSPF